MNNNTMSIYEALMNGKSIANKSAMRISESRVSVDDFAKWSAAMKTALDPFYQYACEVRKVAIAETFGEEYVISQKVKDVAFPALANIFACIGKVNGFVLRANDEIMAQVAMTAVVMHTTLIGEADTQASIVKNLYAEVKSFANGMNPEYIRAKTLEYETAKEKLALLKKQEGSCKRERVKASPNAFRIALEIELASLVTKQENIAPEVLAEREATLKAERDAKRKANKLAKQSAK